MGGVNEFFASLPPWLGTLPNWITASGVVAFLGILLKYKLGIGDLGIRAQQVKVEAQKAESDMDDKLMGHFGNELKRLTDLVNASEIAHKECKERCEKCEGKIRHLEETQNGMQRIIAFNSSSLLLDSDGRPSEAVKAAAVSVLEKLAKGEPPTSGEEGK